MSTSTTHQTYTTGVVKTRTVHSAATADGTSDAIPIAGAKAIMIIFTGAGSLSDRQADMTVDISGDGSNFYDYSMMLDNTTDSNSESLTRVATKNISSDGTSILWMSPETLGAITHMKVALDVTDATSPAGNFTVKLVICT